MTNWCEVGKLYVWKNHVGETAYLNGQETIVTSDIQDVYVESQFIGRGQQTSARVEDESDCFWHAEPGDLRPKNPPPGQQLITDLFKQPETCEG